MKLVVDTNILVSFFRKNPVNELISKSKFFNLQLFSPAQAIEELNKKRGDLLKYSGLSSKQLDEKLKELASLIRIISKDNFKEFKGQAEQLTHEKDIPFFALALSLNCAIWSNEPSFKEQSKVQVLSTREMIELFF